MANDGDRKSCLDCMHCIEDTTQSPEVKMARLQAGQLGPTYICIEGPPHLSVSVAHTGQLITAQGYPNVHNGTTPCHRHAPRALVKA